MRTARFLIWLICGVAPLTCAAQIISDERSELVRGAYLSMNVGIGDYKLRDPPAGVGTDICLPGSIDCQDSPTGGKLTAGYMFWPYFGLEAVAYNMGDASVKFDLGGGSILEQIVRLQGYGLSLVGALPLGPVRLNARAGYAAATAVRKDELNGVNVGRSHKSRAEPLLGAGVSVQVWRGLFVSLDWDHARARTALGEKFEADLYSAGVGWRF